MVLCSAGDFFFYKLRKKVAVGVWVWYNGVNRNKGSGFLNECIICIIIDGTASSMLIQKYSIQGVLFSVSLIILEKA